MKKVLCLFAAPMMLILAGTSDARACTQSGANSYGKYINAEHAKRRAIKGTFRTVRIEKRHSEDIGDWELIYGEITLKSGKILETIHTRNNEIILCGRPEGPGGDSVGKFYLNKNKKDGRFEIFDWRGDYLPQPAPSKD